MKLPLQPGTWLFSTCIIYALVAVINLFVYKFTSTEYIEMTWLWITAMPLFFPMRKVVSIDPIWRM